MNLNVEVYCTLIALDRLINFNLIFIIKNNTTESEQYIIS